MESKPGEDESINFFDPTGTLFGKFDVARN
jgi:hypothetical protein